MADTPIANAENLSELGRRLAEQPGWHWVGTADPAMLEKALAAPAAIAWWLRQQGALPNRLQLLVVGAEWLDALDQGRWYQALGALTGQGELPVSVTLVGPELAQAASDISVPQGLEPAESICEPLSQAVLGARQYDLAVLFQPGLEQAGGILEQGLLSELSRAAPLMLSSYSADEQAMEAGVVSAYGFTPGQALPNPFGLPVEGARWADCLWSLTGTPGPSQTVDTGTVERIRQLSHMLAHSRMQGLAMALAHYGTAHHIPTRAGEQRLLIHGMDGFYADAATGKVYGVRDGTLVATDRTAPQELLHRWPGMEADVLERALWAGEFKARVLMGHSD